MPKSAMLAAVMLVLSFGLQPILSAQTKPAPAPAPPPTPPPSSSRTYSTPSYTVDTQPHQDLSRQFSMDERPLISKIGQGSVYVPEINVPREPKREYRQGMDALKKNDFKVAAQHLLRASELYPKFSSAFNGLGIAYELDPDKRDKATGFNPEAKTAFRRAVSLNPYNDKALTNLGFVLLKENSSVEAEKVLRTAVAIQSGVLRAYTLLMMAQAMQQHYDDVLLTAQHIRHGEEDKFPMVYYIRAVAWDNKSNRQQATRDYRQFLKLSPSASEATSARAALVRLGAN